MTLQQLRYAIAIAESGSLNKAAQVLYVAQPSLSSAVQELEKELGIIHFSPKRPGCHPHRRRCRIFAVCQTALFPI